MYLRNTVDLGLFFRKGASADIVIVETSEDGLSTKPKMELPEGMRATGYTDASYGQEDDRKSRSGYLFMVFGCPVVWYSKKQSTTALSSTEAELNAAVEGVKEATWMRMFLRELGFAVESPTVMHQDNQSVIAIAVNPIHHARIKHMEIKTHYIRENVENSTVKLLYCPTELMIADVLTKALPGPQHWKLVDMMGMRRLSMVMEGNYGPTVLDVSYKQ